jgi:cellulose synthase/poly-beta-1,6-N-acetylglucosamine synthase-like glycosyltransferase
LIFIIDADNRIDSEFLHYALPRFNDGEVAAFFGRSQVIWPDHVIPKLKYYFVAYRERLNFLLQHIYMFGQTSQFANATYVIPGSSTLYRSDVLSKLDLGTPGIINEDFHLAFQLYKYKLGKVASDARAIGREHSPDNLRDYWRQVRRWNIGFYQTIRLNGIWPSFFWVTLASFSFEVMINSLYVVLVFVFLPLILAGVWADHLLISTNWSILKGQLPLVHNVTITTFIFGMFLVDYWITAITALIKKRPMWLIYGLFFYVMHFVTALILFTAIIPGLFKSFDGRWVSPTRQEV